MKEEFVCNVNTNCIEVPMLVIDEISYWFSKHKCHRKARNIKSVKRKFLRKYGKNTEDFFDHVCCDINVWRWK